MPGLAWSSLDWRWVLGPVLVAAPVVMALRYVALQRAQHRCRFGLYGGGFCNRLIDGGFVR